MSRKFFIFLITIFIFFIAFFLIQTFLFSVHVFNGKVGVDLIERINIDDGTNLKIIKEKYQFVILRAVRCWDADERKDQHNYKSIIDDNFITNWLDLKKIKKTKGAYHVFSTGLSGKEQFEVYKQNVQLEKGDLPPILDPVTEIGIDINEAQKWIDLARDYYKTDPIIYIRSQPVDYWGLKLKNCKFWIYDSKEELSKSFYSSKIVIQQYKQNITTDNMKIKVDLNKFLGDSNDFEKLLIK
jgi:lysozyme